MIAFQLFQKILSLFLILGSGTLLVKLKVIRSADSRLLSALSLYLIVPAVIINMFTIKYTPEILKGFLISSVAALAILIYDAVLGRVLRRPLKLSPAEECSVVYSNAGNLIIPIVTSILGPEWVLYTTPFICLQPIFVWTHGYKVLCGGSDFSLKKIFTNVNMICILIGALIFAFQIPIPGLLSDALSSISATLGPVSMLIVGMLIGGMELKKVFINPRVWLVTGLRLIVFPLVPLFVLSIPAIQALHQSGFEILMITLLAACAPSASMTTQMAQIYGQDAETASAINVVSTLSCIATMPLMILLYQR